MNRTVSLLALLLVFPQLAQAAHYKVFVLTGQSNSLGTTNGAEVDLSPGNDASDARTPFFWHNVADASTSLGDSGGVFTDMQSQQGGFYPGSATHWGPEMNFARTLDRAGVENVAIIKASRGGGGNTNWSKTASGHMYSHVVNTVTTATTALTSNGDTFEIVGLLYVQGESDNTSEAAIAGTRFKELVDNLRIDLPNASALHGIIGGIASVGATSDTVRAQHEAIATNTAYIDYFSNLDLQAQVSDGLHFNKAAKLRIGNRFARAFVDAGIASRHYGKLTFIGDSITQGGNGNPSYRYTIFSHLASEGVPNNPATGYEFVGSVTGAYQGNAGTTPDVSGQTFSNIHDGHWGWRTFWVNDRLPLPANRRDNNRGEGTLLNWTAQASPQEYDISAPSATVSYPDLTATGTGNTGTTYTPDTAVVMIGINDLGDDNNSANQVISDLGTLVDQLRAVNPNVRIFINHLLETNQTQAMKDGVAAVNTQLPALAATKNTASTTSPVWIIDAGTGFNPVTLTYDNVHPNTQGEQYVGDRIAAAMGLIEPPALSAPPPPHIERDGTSLDSTFEGNEIWDGTNFVNNWSQFGTLTKSLPAPTDLRVIHPSTGGRWIDGTNTGWTNGHTGNWTFETRLKFDANANGFILWLGTGSNRILVEVHGDRTQDSTDGGSSFNVAHNNLDGAFHTFRVAHDAAAGKYHVWRDGARLSPLDGADYDQSATENRLILGDYTSGTFGNFFDATIDHARYDQTGAYLPPGADADSDGMPDAWEYQYFSTITGADPNGDPDEDTFSNLVEYQNGTNPLTADGISGNILPVHLITGEGNAHGNPATTTLNSIPIGSHPAEQAGGVWFHDGTAWTVLAAAPDASFGPEIAFARLLWDTGHRDFGIVKSTTTGGNSLWQKPSGTAYLDLVSTATSAASTPPTGFDSVAFRSLLYVQGESNDPTEADAADTRLTDLLSDLRTDLPSASTMEAVLGEISGSGTDRDTTRSRHLSLATSNNDIGLARATGLSTHNLDALNIHYTADSLFLLGARMAAEAIRMNLTGSQPLPAWPDLHAWYIADHASGFDGSTAVNRWGAVHDGSATRDLTRQVGGPTFRNTVTANGSPRQVLRFDGTNDLWANASTEFGTLSGERTVAVLCRLIGSGEGFLFDGSTNTGRTRAQVRAGSWQAGVTPAGTGIAWNLADPQTATADPGWQRHIFTFTPNAGSTATTVEHWIDGSLEGSHSENEVATLGGLILGSNGGSPFTRLPVEIAEVAVYGKTLDSTEVAALDTQWQTTWGSPTGPPFSVRVSQTPRDIPRFGSHAVLEIPITAETTGTITVDSIALTLTEAMPGNVESWRIHAGESFNPSSTPLAETTGGTSTWEPALNLSLLEGTNRLFLVAVPYRHGALGSGIDASVDFITFSGEETGDIVPTTPDPAGELTLALVPLFQDVVQSGDLGINTFRIPGITIDSAGVLHAVYDHRYAGGSDLPADVDVGYARSTDGGATWSESVVIMDFDASVPGSSGNGVGDPCILYDPVTDTLWVAALWSFGNNGYNGSGPGTDPADTGQYVLVKSEDGGTTWSDIINITVDVKDDPNWRLIFQGPGHGLAMRDGTLVFPSQYRDASGTVRVCSVFSTDHGVTWDFGSGVPTSSPQTNENTVCELDDGRLLFSMRTPSGSNGQRAWIHYTPGGTTPMRDGTWDTLFRLPSVPDPVCQGSVIQWTSTHRGDPREFILSGNPGSSSSRTNFTLRISPDGGDSWPVSRSVYAGPSAYSSLCILPDRSIGILFEKDNYTRITFARVEEAWLLDPSVDTDNDDMPDNWEVLVGLNPSFDDSDLDPDGDGSANGSEYTAGTNPLDASSTLAVSNFSSASIAWHSIPGKFYAIEESTDLDQWSTVPGAEAILSSSAETTVPITATSDLRRFLRVRALP